MTALYNENNPFAAAWLRNLIAAGRLPPGRVAARSAAEFVRAVMNALWATPPEDASSTAGMGPAGARSEM